MANAIIEDVFIVLTQLFQFGDRNTRMVPRRNGRDGQGRAAHGGHDRLRTGRKNVGVGFRACEPTLAHQLHMAARHARDRVEHNNLFAYESAVHPTRCRLALAPMKCFAHIGSDEDHADRRRCYRCKHLEGNCRREHDSDEGRDHRPHCAKEREERHMVHFEANEPHGNGEPNERDHETAAVRFGTSIFTTTLPIPGEGGVVGTASRYLYNVLCRSRYAQRGSAASKGNAKFMKPESAS